MKTWPSLIAYGNVELNGTVNIDGTRFSFPDGWRVLKYDDCSLHRNQFQPFAGGSKALDAVALAPDRTMWLIEVKDYSDSRRSKAGTVFSEVAAKVRATLAELAVARVRATDDDERDFAHEALTLLCRQVGQRIRSEVLKDSRAEYGQHTVATLSLSPFSVIGQVAKLRFPICENHWWILSCWIWAGSTRAMSTLTSSRNVVTNAHPGAG